ncbi:MAG: hypothetical protein ACYCXG_09715 [Acidiferrobacter sp.]
MYTRRAKVLFMAADPQVAAAAVAAAGVLGAAWIEAEGGDDLRPGFDLVVTLDKDVHEHFAPKVAGRYRYWPLSPTRRDADLAAHIASLIGGMRLLARLDESGAPGDR